MALFGVSNGALQFMTYEKMKQWGFERKRRQFAKAGREWLPADDKLVCGLPTRLSLDLSELLSISQTHRTL